jgi:gluconokinase
MDQPLPPVTIVMGVSGCGKSTYGAALAVVSGARFVEGDDFHGVANLAKMRAGVALTDEDRWPWLDRIAGAVNAAVGEGESVVATCSALRHAYRDRLRAGITTPVRFVLLDVPIDELRRRVATRDHFMPPGLLDSQLATLEWPGADEAVEIVQPPSAPNPLPAVQPPSAGSTTPDT